MSLKRTDKLSEGKFDSKNSFAVGEERLSIEIGPIHPVTSGIYSQGSSMCVLGRGWGAAAGGLATGVGGLKMTKRRHQV